MLRESVVAMILWNIRIETVTLMGKIVVMHIQINLTCILDSDPLCYLYISLPIFRHRHYQCLCALKLK